MNQIGQSTKKSSIFQNDHDDNDDTHALNYIPRRNDISSRTKKGQDEKFLDFT